MDAIFDQSMASSKKNGHSPGPALMGNLKRSTIPIVCATTTLSGGEFNTMGAATNDRTHEKHLFHPGTQTGPKIIIPGPGTHAHHTLADLDRDRRPGARSRRRGVSVPRRNPREHRIRPKRPAASSPRPPALQARSRGAGAAAGMPNSRAWNPCG